MHRSQYCMRGGRGKALPRDVPSPTVRARWRSIQHAPTVAGTRRRSQSCGEHARGACDECTGGCVLPPPRCSTLNLGAGSHRGPRFNTTRLRPTVAWRGRRCTRCAVIMNGGAQAGAVCAPDEF
jgi:hypothetical protein